MTRSSFETVSVIAFLLGTTVVAAVDSQRMRSEVRQVRAERSELEDASDQRPIETKRHWIVRRFARDLQTARAHILELEG